MLKRYNVWLDPKTLKELQRIGQQRGNLKTAQVIRIALADFVRREKRKVSQ